MVQIFGCRPDNPVLGSTPEGVGPHGRCGDALHSIGVIGKHVDGFLHRQVVHVDLSVGGACDQNPVPGVREELCRHTKTHTRNVSQRLPFKSHSDPINATTERLG